MSTRIFTTTLGGQTIELAATFKAANAIADKIADPLQIAREAAMEAMFIAQGMPYEPRWRFTVKNIPEVLFIGLQAAGSKMSKADVEELCFEAGFFESREAASSYLALIVGPEPEETIEKDGDSEGN